MGVLGGNGDGGMEAAGDDDDAVVNAELEDAECFCDGMLLMMMEDSGWLGGQA